MNRPQTRRRRENNADSLDKLYMIRENVVKALDIFECLVKRERKKRDLVVRRPLRLLRPLGPSPPRLHCPGSARAARLRLGGSAGQRACAPQALPALPAGASRDELACSSRRFGRALHHAGAPARPLR